MAQQKLAQLIAIDELLHVASSIISWMIPDKYLYCSQRQEVPQEYQYMLNAQTKLYEVSREIDKVTNLNISKKL